MGRINEIEDKKIKVANKTQRLSLKIGKRLWRLSKITDRRWTQKKTK